MSGADDQFPASAPSMSGGGYVLGLDLGTTFTAAAVASTGSSSAAEIVSLGHTAAVVPSVIVVRAEGEMLVGEAAERRADSEPTRTAREFKRRLGDPVPYVLGGVPFGSDALTGHLMRHVYDRVVEQQGSAPAKVVVAHPANYGDYKLDLLREAIRSADIADVELFSEPAAAATHYAQQDRLDVGDIVAVYDFGGGTFDAAVVEVTDEGHRIIGTPEGMERLGGIDFDQAVYAHVMTSLGDISDHLDPADPAVAAALARLRDDCRTAKEALSSDTDVDIPVLLPNLHTQVRLTRPEFEAMIRPRIAETIESLTRAIRSAGHEPGDVARVLLVGGSSRIPLVAEMVGAAVGRPVALDAHPKHAIALGAALHAAQAAYVGEPPVIAGVDAAAAAGTTAAAISPPAPPPPAPPPPASGAVESADPPRPKRVGLVVAAVAVLLALVAGVVVISSGGDDETATSLEPSNTAAVGSAAPAGAPTATDAATAGDAPATTEAPATTQPDDVFVTAGEVILEPLSDEPNDVFTESVAAEPSPELLAFARLGRATDAAATDSVPTEPPSDDTPDGPTTLISLSGTAPGVYGGTRDELTCDPDLLVEALGRRPAEAAAWAGVHDIEVDGIPDYVDLLTALNLTVDTRVTNHGFLEGDAIPRQSVLQVGTAVLVDEFGVPRVRCSSGSPLLPPEAVEGTTTYRGQAWDEFDPTEIAAVAAAPEPVVEFEVLDVSDGDRFIRTVGSSGSDDRGLLPGEILAVGEIDFPTDGFGFVTNSVEIVFSPTGGPVTGTFDYSISAQGVNIAGSGELAGTFDPQTLVMDGSVTATVDTGFGAGGTGEGGWTAEVRPEAGEIIAVVDGEGDEVGTFSLTFPPYTPPADS